MPNIVVSVPHQLALSEVCWRIAGWLLKAKKRGPFESVHGRWRGNQLDFDAEINGKMIKGQLVATAIKVTAVIALPWLFIAFGPVIKKLLAQELRKLLKP